MTGEPQPAKRIKIMEDMKTEDAVPSTSADYYADSYSHFGIHEVYDGIEGELC